MGLLSAKRRSGPAWSCISSTILSSYFLEYQKLLWASSRRSRAWPGPVLVIMVLTVLAVAYLNASSPFTSYYATTNYLILYQAHVVIHEDRAQSYQPSSALASGYGRKSGCTRRCSWCCPETRAGHMTKLGRLAGLSSLVVALAEVPAIRGIEAAAWCCHTQTPCVLCCFCLFIQLLNAVNSGRFCGFERCYFDGGSAFLAICCHCFQWPYCFG